MAALLLSVCASGLLISSSCSRPTVCGLGAPRIPGPRMAIDYKDPAVSEEFNKVQEMAIGAVEDELGKFGIPVPPAMNEMDIRLMLVETRMRKSGRMGGESGKVAKKEKPTSFANEFERAMYEHPAFEKLFKAYSGMGDTNSVNVCTEYLLNKKQAIERYSKNYGSVIDAIEAALAAPVVQEVTSPRISFDGFPGNMGEMGVKMTLEAIGTLEAFDAVESDDGTTWYGTAAFEDIDTAKKAIEKYDGMDMGAGPKLSIRAL